MEVLIILLLSLTVYFRTLRYKYVSDDVPVFQNPPHTYNGLHRRFLQFLGTLHVNEQQDHLITLSIHTLVCVFIYLGFGASRVSLLAAILFCVNPANNQGSIWISGRGYSLPLLCLLMAKTFAWLSPLFLFACAHFAIGFPAIAVLLGSPQWWMIVFAPLIWYMHFADFKKVVKGRVEAEAVPEDKRIKPRKFILALKTLGFYFTLAIFPFKLSFYHSFLQSAAGNPDMRKLAYKMDKFFFIGLALVLSWAAYSILHWDITAYGIFWFMFSVAPFCNFIRAQQEIAERYVYFANAGLMIALASVLVNFPYAGIALFIFYLTRTWYWMPAYFDDYWMIEHSIIESPGSWYAWHIRALKRWERGSANEALTMWVMAKLLSPKEFKVLFNIAVILRLLHKDKEAQVYLKLAKENVIEGQEKTAEQLFRDWDQGKLPILQ